MSTRLSSLGALLIALGSITLACEVTTEAPSNDPEDSGDAGARDEDNEPGGASSGGKGNNGGKGNSGGKNPGSAAGAASDPDTEDPEDPVPGTDGSDDEPDERVSSRFFLPTPEPTNTTAPTLEVDAKGGVHAVYPRYAIGGAFYSYCATGCEESSNTKVVEFETQGTVLNAMLALDEKARPRVLLSTAQKVYYASCDSNCGTAANWETSEILDHMGDREVSGEAFALDPEGNPRFLMHTYRALFGIGQKPRATFYVSCDSDCHSPASWSSAQISNQTWEGTNFEYDAQGRAHIATIANLEEDGVVTSKNGAYLYCDADCGDESSWIGTGLYPTYENNTEAVSMVPTLSLALTRSGLPRIALLGKDPEAGTRNIMYFTCDEECSELSSWKGATISNHEKIESGLDLALDKNGHPRLAYTLDYNIGLAYCDGADCTTADWGLTKVEFSSDIPTDDIFLEWNCTVAAWFLHDPSIAIGPNGEPRIGYQARDISGGFSRPDPLKPRCEAGTDMTLSRIAVMNSHTEE